MSNNIEDQIGRLGCEKEPYVGMPLPNLSPAADRRKDRCDCDMDYPDQKETNRDPLAGLPIAMAYVPWQCWGKTYKPTEGWHRGTIFPELDLPFLGGGMR